MLRGLLTAVVWLAMAGAAIAQEEPVDRRLPPADPERMPLSFSIIKTSEAHSQEGMIVQGGDLFKAVTVVHSAVLVKHPRGTFLFDTGLGRGIDAQWNAEMPLWIRPVFAYGPVRPVRDQLDAAGVPPITAIIPSHAHWDHVSGLVDFPEAKVWLSAPEWVFMRHAKPPVLLRSQVDPPSITYDVLSLRNNHYAGYAYTQDLFGDGSAVLVSMPGHTPGSTGLFLTTGSGERFFFVGDTAWNMASVQRHQPKFWLASKIVDHDGEGTQQALETVRAVLDANPNLHVIPAHDGEAQAPWGYFPRWVD